MTYYSLALALKIAIDNRREIQLMYFNNPVDGVQDILQERQDNHELKPEEAELLNEINTIVQASK